MENLRFTENDWKLFKSKIGGWQEAYMEKLNREYIALLELDNNASAKFWELEKRIKTDRRSVGVRAEMTRAQFIPNLIALVNDGAITLNDLSEFSEELRETIAYFVK